LENCFPYTWSEEDGCYFDYNNDEIYLLCVDNEENSGYNADGTENNDEFDCDLDNDGNCEENGRSEYWQDLGLDGADDDYETGCRLSGYNHGAGYTGDADETYIELINGNVDFYETEYTLKNGVEIRLCGQQYWDNPVDGKECRVCSIDDPNGDNYNSDPGEDNHPLGGEGNGEYDIGEPFLDFGIDQIENFPFDDTGTEGNETWDLGEQFFDTGIDSTFTGDEEGYCLECRQGNDLKDRILDSNGDELFSEYRDYGFDDCPNEYETGNSENPCDESIDNFYSIDKAGYLDLNRDDINEDPNGDNWHSVNNPEGLEGNQSYECDPNVGCEGLDENITLDASMLDGYLVNLGSNLYPYGLDGTEDYLQPTASGLEKVTLWISKIEQNEEGSYKLTISMSSQVDINSFEIQLYHNKKSSLEMLPTIITKQLSPFKYENTEDYDDVQFNGTTSFLEDSEKYIKDVSLYPFSPLSNISSDDNLISYDYGMEAKLYFDGLNDFLSNNDETAFISHEQTHLFIYIDTSFDRYPITDEGLFLKISGNIGNILVEDFIDPIPIKIDSNTDSRIKIRIGRLVDELLLNSDELSDDIENANITLSLDSYTHVEYTEQITGQYFHQINPTTYSNFSILKLSNEELPHINIFYSE